MPNEIIVQGHDATVLGVCPGTVRHLESTLDFAARTWVAPVVFAGPFEVYDFTQSYDANRDRATIFGIGRFNEDRRGMYDAEIFKTSGEARTIHMGIDLAALEGTPIFAPLEGTIWGAEILSAEGDYGGTIILETQTAEAGTLFMLFGHLSHASVARWKKGDRVGRGDLIAWLGSEKENGGWNPHLHWQISRLEPLKVDLPGAVAPSQHENALAVFIDPTPILAAVKAGIGRVVG